MIPPSHGYILFGDYARDDQDHGRGRKLWYDFFACLWFQSYLRPLFSFFLTWEFIARSLFSGEAGAEDGPTQDDEKEEEREEEQDKPKDSAPELAENEEGKKTDDQESVLKEVSEKIPTKNREKKDEGDGSGEQGYGALFARLGPSTPAADAQPTGATEKEKGEEEGNEEEEEDIFVETLQETTAYLRDLFSASSTHIVEGTTMVTIA